MKPRMQLQLLVLCCTILACAVPARALQQAPPDLTDQEVVIEQVCGGGWARSRYSYKSGIVINVDERWLATVQAAECAFDEATLSADHIFDHSIERDLNGAVLSRAVFLIVEAEALHLERQGQWLITRRSDSLDDLRSFVGDSSRRPDIAPPN